MGVVISNALSFGANMGIASYQASVGQTDLAIQSLKAAVPQAGVLANRGITQIDPLNNLIAIAQQNADLANSIVTLRENYDAGIRQKGFPYYADLYAAGMLIGIAEGQASGPFSDQARSIARDSLLKADTLMFHKDDFRKIGFDPTILFTAIHGLDGGEPRETMYNVIKNMRVEYNGEASNAPD